MVETLRTFALTNNVGCDMSVPDQFRADFVLKELCDFSARGEFPLLNLICLPNDHTSGTSKPPRRQRHAWRTTISRSAGSSKP